MKKYFQLCLILGFIFTSILANASDTKAISVSIIIPQRAEAPANPTYKSNNSTKQVNKNNVLQTKKVVLGQQEVFLKTVTPK